MLRKLSEATTTFRRKVVKQHRELRRGYNYADIKTALQTRCNTKVYKPAI